MLVAVRVAAQKMSRNAKLLALIWLLSIGYAAYTTWPAQHLVQDAPPKLPNYEDCPRDFDNCFAQVLRQRIRMAQERDDFYDAYGARVFLHLAEATGLSLLFAGVYWCWRKPRKSRKRSA